ncbi:1-acylglycerol-3-phosphate O-acyltransferase Pnpla3-like [Culicoides brevitarsis]|uniref:1-acylglycerol-3-phosphate O-acyltransferase Pnpla3-like n=1 Tax=Culicoides brevitarsis TaxID=469753 RepID=UPI00307B7C13
MNLSFAGCGFLGVYHVGAAVCFRTHAPHLLRGKITGASAGALTAVCLLCDLSIAELTSAYFHLVNGANPYTFGLFNPLFDLQKCIKEGLQKFLPEDAHERCTGKLHISLTRVYDGKNVIVSQYNSRDELINALLCACFIPMISGVLPPRFYGVRYMDSGFSDNLPTLDEHTVTVSPFCGESDICPRDDSWKMFHLNWTNTSIEISKKNFSRFRGMFFAPEQDVMMKMCQSGFDDALCFLQRNILINCERCLTISYANDDNFMSQHTEDDPECEKCIEKRNEAKEGFMPESVLNVFETNFRMLSQKSYLLSSCTPENLWKNLQRLSPWFIA